MLSINLCIYHIRWEAGSVIHLAAIFRDVPLTNDELRFVIEKIVRLFREVEMSDMPALVYQLLLLSTKVSIPQPLYNTIVWTHSINPVS